MKTQKNSNTESDVATQPDTFLFIWNPNNWTWSYLPEAVTEANSKGYYRDKWSCVSHRQIKIGDRIFLMRVGIPPKGIMGSGIVASAPFEDLHWDEEKASRGEKVYRVEIIFDVLSEIPIIEEKDIGTGKLSDYNWFPQSSGIRMPANIAKELENQWSLITKTTFEPISKEELPNLRIEGTKKSRLIAFYERNNDAREECIRYYGAACQVCGISFGKFYGKIGEGYIHVHHIIPISQIGEEHEIDPIKDLRPVCPNCHAILHKRTPPFSIQDLKSAINNSDKTRKG